MTNPPRTPSRMPRVCYIPPSLPNPPSRCSKRQVSKTCGPKDSCRRVPRSLATPSASTAPCPPSPISSPLRPSWASASTEAWQCKRRWKGMKGAERSMPWWPSAPTASGNVCQKFVFSPPVRERKPSILKQKTCLVFNEAALRQLVQLISQTSQLLLEIVNFNIQDQQYVCAGHVR